MRKDEGMKIQKRKRSTIAIILITLFALAGVGYFCSFQISRNLRAEMENTAQDVANQNNIALQQEINSRLQLLYSIADELGRDPEDVHELVDSTKAFVDNYRFKRLGFIYPIGLAYSTDGYIPDMSYLDFFENGMAGRITITDARQDVLCDDDSYVCWLSVPVYGENRRADPVAGVLFASYHTEWFEDVLDTQAFEGRGYSCIIKPDGEIVAHSAGSPIGVAENFFSYMENEQESKAFTRMRTDIEAKASGAGSFSLQGKQEFYYMPLDLEDRDLDWYMITMVPETVLAERLSPIMSNIDMPLALMILIILIGASIFFWFNRLRRAELMKLAYEDSPTQGDNFACFQEKMKMKKGALWLYCCHGFESV